MMLRRALLHPPPSTTTRHHLRSFSSYSPVEWWRQRQAAKEGEKYKAKLQKLATQSAFTLADMHEDIQEAVNSWTAKLPGVGSSKEVEAAKSMNQLLEGFKQVLGADATNVSYLTRAQKLQVAVQAGGTVQDVNMLVTQFETMSLMQRILRDRHEQGKKVPETPEAIQALLQSEGQKYLSKTQREGMAKKSRQMMLKRR